MGKRTYFWNRLSKYERRQVLTVAWRKLLAYELVEHDARDEFMDLADLSWSNIHPGTTYEEWAAEMKNARFNRAAPKGPLQ